MSRISGGGETEAGAGDLCCVVRDDARGRSNCCLNGDVGAKVPR